MKNLSLKHLCKYEEKKYRNKVLSELQAASDKNEKAFWDILNKMNRQKNSCNAYDEILSQDEFINFHKDLYSCERIYFHEGEHCPSSI